MKFIKDYNYPAFVVWGTKRGMQVFFHEGIDEDTKTVLNAFSDFARSSVSYSRPLITFFSIERKKEYISYSAYRTIDDWVGRLGYFSVSLMIPSGKRFPASKIYELLLLLLERYYENNIKNNISKPNRIRENVNEEANKALFHSFVEKPENFLLPDTRTSGTFGSHKCYMEYKDIDELQSIFDNHQNPQLSDCDLIFLFPVKESELSSFLDRRTMPDVNRKITLTIDIKKTQSHHQQVQISYIVLQNKPGNQLGTEVNVSSNPFSISGLSTTDTVKIMITGNDNKEYSYFLRLEQIVGTSEQDHFKEPIDLASIIPFPIVIKAEPDPEVNKSVWSGNQIRKSPDEPRYDRPEPTSGPAKSGKKETDTTTLITKIIANPLFRILALVIVLAGIGVAVYFLFFFGESSSGKRVDTEKIEKLLTVYLKSRDPKDYQITIDSINAKKSAIGTVRSDNYDENQLVLDSLKQVLDSIKLSNDKKNIETLLQDIRKYFLAGTWDCINATDYLDKIKKNNDGSKELIDLQEDLKNDTALCSLENDVDAFIDRTSKKTKELKKPLLDRCDALKVKRTFMPGTSRLKQVMNLKAELITNKHN